MMPIQGRDSFLFFIPLGHLSSKEGLSVFQRHVGIMDSATVSSSPVPHSPIPIFSTHHQDTIGDDFRCRHLTEKMEEGSWAITPFTMAIKTIWPNNMAAWEAPWVVERETGHPACK